MHTQPKRIILAGLGVLAAIAAVIWGVQGGSSVTLQVSSAGTRSIVARQTTVQNQPADPDQTTDPKLEPRPPPPALTEGNGHVLDEEIDLDGGRRRLVPPAPTAVAKVTAEEALVAHDSEGNRVRLFGPADQKPEVLLASYTDDILATVDAGRPASNLYTGRLVWAIIWRAVPNASIPRFGGIMNANKDPIPNLTTQRRP